MFALKFDYNSWIDQTFSKLEHSGGEDQCGDVGGNGLLLLCCWDDDADLDKIWWSGQTFGKLDDPGDDDDDRGQQLGKSEVILHLRIMMIIL